MIDRLSKLLQLHAEAPKDAFLNHALALEYIKLAQEDKALLYFNCNLHNDPNYIATYYHLGKLQERNGHTDDAINTYQKGMELAKAQNDMHTYNELQAAWEDLAY